MASAWPSALQEFLNEASFNLDIGNTVITTQMDVGLAKKRRRYTKGIDEVNCTIDLDRDNYIDLYSFFNNTLNGGVGTFLFDHPITGDVDLEWRFVEPPKIIPIGGRNFRVNMQWELLP